MSLPTNAQEIYDLLSEDPVLPGLLGVYLLPEAETKQAMAVLMPGENLSEEWGTAGVEVVISRFPSNQPQPLATGGVMLRPTFRLYASQHGVDRGDTYNLQEVVERILTLLPGATALDSTLPGGIGGLAQVAIRWLNPEPAAGILPLEVTP